MTNPIFNEYLLDLNAYMASQNRKILLFLDNAPMHIVDEEKSLRLTHVNIPFFPPKFTSLLQPLDAGIIRSVEAPSRKHQVLHLLKLIEIREHAADPAKKLQFIDAMEFMATSWGSVMTETIQKCFKA